MTEPGTHLDAVTLFTEDLEGSKQFYREVLGLALVFEDANSAAFRLGHTIINCLKTPEAHSLIAPARVAGPGAGARVQFTIGVPDVDAWGAELRARGMTLLNGPMIRPWGMRTLSIQDPGGHIWEFGQDL